MATIVRTTLLIDDSDIDLFIQRRLLEVYNFSRELHSFESAVEALQWLGKAGKEEVPDIIFLDLNMPEMDGFEFLTQFNELPLSVKGKSKIVIATSSNDPEEKKRALASEGVILFITKPLKKADIEALVKLLEAKSPV